MLLSCQDLGEDCSILMEQELELLLLMDNMILEDKLNIHLYLVYQSCRLRMFQLDTDTDDKHLLMDKSNLNRMSLR